MIDSKWMSSMILLLFVLGAAFGQSKKTIREKGIISCTVEEYFIEEGMDEPVIESFEKFDKNGELVELQEFNRRGDLKKWEKYVYNDNGEVVEEVFLDAKGRVTRTEKTIYEGDMKVEKHFFNNKGYLTKKKVYKYEYR